MAVSKSPVCSLSPSLLTGVNTLSLERTKSRSDHRKLTPQLPKRSAWAETRHGLLAAAAGAGAGELAGGAGKPCGEDLDELDRGVGVLADHFHEELLGDLEGLDFGEGLGGGGARHFAVDRNFTQQIVLAHGVDDER